MKISVLCNDKAHPVVPQLRSWVTEMSIKGHEVEFVYDKDDLKGGELLFMVSCSQMLNQREICLYNHSLLLHASDLPKGRGWSPHVWSILNGDSEITVSLLEAEEKVDSGDIWLKTTFSLEGHELLPEINAKLFHCELSLMSQAVEKYESILPIKQTTQSYDYMPKRTPEDSRIDPNKTIAEQFNLLRVVDAKRYPAFFDYLGQRYILDIRKVDNDE